MTNPVVSPVYDPDVVPHIIDTVTLLAVPIDVSMPLTLAELVVIPMGLPVMINGVGGKVVKPILGP